MLYSRSARARLAIAAVAAVLCLGAAPAFAATSGDSATCKTSSPSNKKMSDMVVGFSQSENLQNPFRAEETKSIREAAKAMGVKRLLYANANSDQAKQVSDIQSMVNQGADALIVAPLNSTGLKPALAAAKAKGIPVVTIDRQTAGNFCEDFISFIGSDFHQQAVRAAQELVKASNGKAQIAELQGAYGNSVETARTKGFAEVIDKQSDMSIAAKQSANWSTTEAQKVMSQLLLAHPDLNAVYAQSDTMALGAIKAIKQFGKQPGDDIKIVSIDGIQDLVKLIPEGEVAADVETNPRFGKPAFQAIQDYVSGKAVQQKIIQDDNLYTKDNAEKMLSAGKVY